jgi:hypothetical protein
MGLEDAIGQIRGGEGRGARIFRSGRATCIDDNNHLFLTLPTIFVAASAPQNRLLFAVELTPGTK